LKILIRSGPKIRMKTPELIETGFSGASLGVQRHLPLSPEPGSLAQSSDLRNGPQWRGTLLAAAKLKHVLGSTQKMICVACFSEADEGSILSARVASGLAEIDKGNVLLLDANVATPRLGRLFGIENAPGLQEVLEERLEVKDALRPLEPSNLWMLPLGGVYGSLSSLLTSSRCTQVIDELRKQFRFIVADTGLVKSPESVLLAALSDGVLLALAAGARTRDEVASFQEELRRLRIPLLGVMLTKKS
jgi:Mrp family chromosome partitioning ATPase